MCPKIVSLCYASSTLYTAHGFWIMQQTQTKWRTLWMEWIKLLPSQITHSPIVMRPAQDQAAHNLRWTPDLLRQGEQGNRMTNGRLHSLAMLHVNLSHFSYRLWSNTSSWPNGILPAEGEDVTIEGTWRMLLDISPPPLGIVYVFGELKFYDQDVNFTANTVSTPTYWMELAYCTDPLLSAHAL